MALEGGVSGPSQRAAHLGALRRAVSAVAGVATCTQSGESVFCTICRSDPRMVRMTLCRHVLPGLADRLSIAAVRIPSISVSAVDAVIQFTTPPADVEALLDRIADGQVIGSCADPCVSFDFRGRQESLILARTETQSVGPDQLRIFGWYDNESGFSARMLDMTERLAPPS